MLFIGKRMQPEKIVQSELSKIQFTVGLPTLDNLVKKNPHRSAQCLAFWWILDPVIVTTKTNHHGLFSRNRRETV